MTVKEKAFIVRCHELSAKEKRQLSVSVHNMMNRDVTGAFYTEEDNLTSLGLLLEDLILLTKGKL